MKSAKRWNISAQSHAQDKKLLLTHIDHLANYTRVLQVQMSADEGVYSQLSGSLGTISSLQIPYRQPSWTKEIASCIAIIATLNVHQYSAQDFASISRFITRASSEKQLVLEGDEAIDVFRLLLSFLKDNGSNCKPDKQSGYSMGGSMVLHEVMRSTVQLLIDCSTKLQSIRLEALQVVMQFCDPKALDAETRYAAVDAVGTILLTLATHGDPDKDDPALNKLYERSEISVQMLLENLRNSTNILSRHGGEGMDGIPSKLLVSILRALSQSMSAYSNTSSTKVSMKFTCLFQPHFQSIVQSLHVLFEKVLPAIDKRTPTTKDFSSSSFALSHNSAASASSRRHESTSRGRDSRSTTANPSGASTSVSATSPVTKMWIGSLKLLGALAAFNPGSFMGSWQLFLSNSLAVDSDTTQAVNFMIAASRADEYSHIVRHTYKKEISSSQMKSPIYSALLLAVNPTVRSEAARALRLMIRIDPKYLKKWIRLQSNSYVLILGEASLNKLDIYEKKTNMILKMMQMLAISVSREREESVLIEIFQTIKFLIDIFPMASLNEGIVKFAPIEDLVECIFRLVIKISLEFTLEDGSSVSKTHVSFYAMDWIADMCRSSSPPRSLLRAIGCSLYSKNIYLAFNPLSWRKPPSSPQRNQIEGISYVHTMAKLSSHEPEDSILAHLVNVILAMVHMYARSKYSTELSLDWFHTFITQCRSSTIQQMRLMVARVIDIIVSSDLALENRSPVSADMYLLGDGFSNSTILPDPLLGAASKATSLHNSSFVFKLSEITEILNSMCNDVDHQVRSQALGSLGNAVIVIGWNPSAISHVNFKECLNNLTKGTKDSVGTVREAAYKSLADVILVSGSGLKDVLKPGESICIDECVPSAELYQCIRQGCADSKLTTRTNALGTLSSFLLYSITLCTGSMDGLPVLAQIIDSALETSILMLTSEGNNDKLFPNVVHILSIVTYSIPLLLPVISYEKAISILKDILRVIIYEVTLENMEKYTQLSAPAGRAVLLELTDAEMTKFTAKVADCSSKTQYHIKQRLLLCTAQTIALANYAAHLVLPGLTQNAASEQQAELASIVKFLHIVIPIFFEHGAFETPLLAGKAIYLTLSNQSQDDKAAFNNKELSRIYHISLQKTVEKLRVKTFDLVLLVLLHLFLCSGENFDFATVFVEFLQEAHTGALFIEWLKAFAHDYVSFDLDQVSLSAAPLPLTIDMIDMYKTFEKYPTIKHLVVDVSESLQSNLSLLSTESDLLVEFNALLTDALVYMHEPCLKQSGRLSARMSDEAISSRSSREPHSDVSSMLGPSAGLEEDEI